MENAYKVLRDMIRFCPLALITVKDSKLIAIAKAYLPSDTGIEVECSWKDEVIEKADYSERNIVCNIPYLKEHSHDTYEKRFRIPPGIEGMICLYYISEWLKENCMFNEESGNHYHVDTGKFYSHQYSIPYEEHKWILLSLDKWGYKGKYNSRGVSGSKSTWLTERQTKNTFEFRLGEMTFDYELLIKRIVNCQNIVMKLRHKYELNQPKPKQIKETSFSNRHLHGNQSFYDRLHNSMALRPRFH